MARWKELYRRSLKNSQINASANEVFFNSATDREELTRYGSFNRVIIFNYSNYDAEIRINGLTDNVIPLSARAGAVIEPDDGILFNFIQIVNLDAVNNIAANDISMRAAIAEYQGA
jgi:hypothetical protein